MGSSRYGQSGVAPMTHSFPCPLIRGYCLNLVKSKQISFSSWERSNCFAYTVHQNEVYPHHLSHQLQHSVSVTTGASNHCHQSLRAVWQDPSSCWLKNTRVYYHQAHPFYFPPAARNPRVNLSSRVMYEKQSHKESTEVLADIRCPLLELLGILWSSLVTRNYLSLLSIQVI